MTKAATAAKVTTEVTAVLAAPEAMPHTFVDMSKQPRTVVLSGMAYNVFPQSVALARLGYVYDAAMPPMVYPQTNMAILHMTLGAPDEFAVRGAREAVADAAATEEREFLKSVEAAAARMIEDQAKAARKTQQDAEIAAAEAALVALKKAAAA